MIDRMNKQRIFWGLWLLWTFFVLWGVSLIPFHPDETSILYQSRDFEILLSDPSSLAWNSETPDDYDQTYRLLNGPLPKYVLGLARTIGGFASELVSVDWNWSLSWDANVTAGALPTDELLYVARLLNTLLFAAALPLMYFSAKRLGGSATGFAAAVLFGSNALLLLHARRAMSEAALIFTIALSIWALLNARNRPWLLGLAVGLALTAKLSAAPLALIGLIIVIWQVGLKRDHWKPLLRNSVQFLGMVGLTVFILTPLLWRQPVQAGLAMLTTRLDFTQGQIDTLNEFGLSDQILDSPGERFVAVLAHQYFTPPAFYDVGNYADDTAAQEAAYLAVWGHTLMRGLLGGGIMLLFTLLGAVWAVKGWRNFDNETKRGFATLAVGTLFMGAALIATIPIPVQRYGLPLTPFLILWAAFGVGDILNAQRLPSSDKIN